MPDTKLPTSSAAQTDKGLPELVATTLMGRDWHRLSHDECKIVEILEASGHLTKGHSGFVGYPP